MVDEMDWQAAMSSEVFRNYLAGELHKESVAEANKPTKVDIVTAELEDVDRALTAMESFEEQIKKSPVMLAKFKQAKDFLIRNPDSHGQVDPNFIKGIMMLNLDDEGSNV